MRPWKAERFCIAEADRPRFVARMEEVLDVYQEAFDETRPLDVDYPHAELLALVCDNLNTHDVASLYFAFDAATAHRLARRLRIVYTPKNGSWLNMAEMELSLLSRQCLGSRRFATAAAMDSAVAAWQREHNARQCGTNWRFTTADARVNLKSLYPVPDTER